MLGNTPSSAPEDVFDHPLCFDCHLHLDPCHISGSAAMSSSHAEIS